MPAVCPTRSRGTLRVRSSSRTSAGTLWSPPLVVSGSDVPHSGTLSLLHYLAQVCVWVVSQAPGW
eukprot:980455-Rhodomonas_salina.2